MCHIGAIAIIESLENKVIIVIFSIIINIAISIAVQFMREIHSHMLPLLLHVCLYACVRCGARVRCTIVMLASVPPWVSSCDFIHTAHVCTCVFALAVDAHRLASQRAFHKHTIQLHWFTRYCCIVEAKTIVSCTKHNTCIHMCADISTVQKMGNWSEKGVKTQKEPCTWTIIRLKKWSKLANRI